MNLYLYTQEEKKKKMEQLMQQVAMGTSCEVDL